MRLLCVPSSSRSNRTLSSASSLPRFRPSTTQLSLATPTELPSVLPAFSASPGGDSCQNFIYKLTLLIDALHRTQNDHRKILIASLYLAGDALTWFRTLLRTNAETFIVAENTRQGRESPTATALYLDPVNPTYWTHYPFIIPQLSSFDEFLSALSSRVVPVDNINGEEDSLFGGTPGDETDGGSRATLSIMRSFD